ncbi:hypothetical protein AAF712_002822 [Marasmius tenuissimus]|uniref:F-box domain-containing protein n=1 Tax=Marasmius tenuissimus TaxID=585030 RepID=A0ABR3ABI4_9AGAR
MRLQLVHANRHIIWERILNNGTALAISPRYASATIDLALNPGETLSALLLTSSARIKVVEFTSTCTSRAEWALTLTQHMLPAIIARLPHARHFVLYKMSQRFQFTLLHAAHRQITTLELHNSVFRSFGYTMRQVSLESLETLLLFDDSSSSLDFLTRVVMFLDAPYLTTLTIGNCLSGNSLAIRDTVRAFSRKLTNLHLLDQIRPTDEDASEGTALPPLALLRNLELEASWAGLYLSATGASFPSLHSLVLHSPPEHIMAGLPGFDWVMFRDGLLPIASHLKTLECCYRAHDHHLRDSFRDLVAERLAALGPPLPDDLTIIEGLRDPLPTSPPTQESIAVSTTWDAWEG